MNQFITQRQMNMRPSATMNFPCLDVQNFTILPRESLAQLRPTRKAPAKDRIFQFLASLSKRQAYVIPTIVFGHRIPATNEILRPLPKTALPFVSPGTTMERNEHALGWIAYFPYLDVPLLALASLAISHGLLWINRGGMHASFIQAGGN
jgi:hypothetical protein